MSQQSKLAELQRLLLDWRSAEKSCAHAVLSAADPVTVDGKKDDEARALHRLRVFVDSEPWADLKQGL